MSSGAGRTGHLLARSLGHGVLPPFPSLFSFRVPASSLAQAPGRRLSTSAVRTGHEFDVAAMLGELQAHGVDSGAGWASVGAEDVSVAQFTHGQSNPTFLLDFGGRQRAVLRKKPPGAGRFIEIV